MCAQYAHMQAQILSTLERAEYKQQSEEHRKPKENVSYGYIKKLQPQIRKR